MKTLILLVLCLTGCAELKPTADTAEHVVDDVDQALKAVSAAYTAVCNDEDAGDKPAYCAAAKDNLNRAIRLRNGLVSQ